MTESKPAAVRSRDRMSLPAARTEVAERIASVLIEGFDRHYSRFRETSAGAKQRFEARQWTDVQRAVKERIRFYDERVRECVERLRGEFAVETLERPVWQEVKLLYIGLLVDHKRPELAETFFNSVTTRILRRTYLHNDLMFARAAISTEYIESEPPTYRSYYPNEGGLGATFVQIFRDFAWSCPFADLRRDVEDVVRALLVHHGGRWPPMEPNRQVQVLSSPFYRNKAAYAVGKIVNGHDETPFVIPVLHGEDGLILDTILLDPETMNVLFSLSRAYFMVDMDVPSGYVHFLRTITPTRRRSELYSAIGLGKQGKTLLYRNLVQHLHHSQDLFVEAPGIPGLVMHVFTLPSYPYVFKVIRDVFGPSKHTDRETVKRKFELVKDVDRVGRMADTFEFRNLALPLARFSPELLAQLRTVAASAIDVDGDFLVLKHCYVERRLIPLNLYLDTATPEELEHAVREYGDAIRELAIANVFPGDLLWRNFGVGRNGRVLFYDYDEIEYLMDCAFREIPPAPNPEAELAPEPWHAVGKNDVFPEEFERFLLGRADVREAFMRHHADLLTPEFWRDCQRRVAEGEVVDFFPYPESIRFRQR